LAHIEYLKNEKANKLACWLNQIFSEKPIPEGIETGFPNQYPTRTPYANQPQTSSKFVVWGPQK
jgi:hypothetical protein